VERDILPKMGFVPVIEQPPATMDPGLFGDEPMGLRARLLLHPLPDRFSYNAAQRTLFINFERLSIRTVDDVEAVRREAEQRLQPLGHKVFAVVNYDHAHLDPDIEDAWAQMVRELSDRFYLNVTRYSTGGFLRAKLGPALAARGVAPHVYETAAEARARVRDG
jgi:propionate CoA-transferase